MTMRLRFAPSPTGFLHIGGARTALFNFLYARHHGGKYLLRIEDTDQQRSTPEAIAAILDGLSWLGLEGDEPYILQSTRLLRHQQVAHELLAKGMAYRCYATPEELEEMRANAKAKNLPMGYDGRWRDRPESDHPKDLSYTIRVKMPQDGGATTIKDLVQGDVTIAHDQMDDFVLLRADGTPTYMLSVVVDDHDMEITHIIRGDDHLTNAFRQYHLFKAAGWEPPQFAHIPLIHGADGAKLSKRHGALGVDAYRDMGYLPEALKNYLLRLGWSHGDEEIIHQQQAIEWFDLDAVGRSAARFDFAKLDNLNAHYLREAADERLLPLIIDKIGDKANDAIIKERLHKGIAGLKMRAINLNLLAQNALIYVNTPNYSGLSEKGIKAIMAGLPLLDVAMECLIDCNDWSEQGLDKVLHALAESQALGFGKLAQPMRIAVTGLDQSPGLFEVLNVLGKAESLLRLNQAKTYYSQA